MNSTIRGTLVLGFLSLVVGCAHARFDSFQGHEYTICCRHCGADKWNELTENSCQGSSTLTGGHSEISGATTNAFAMGNSAMATTKVKRENCRTYTCSGQVTPWE